MIITEKIIDGITNEVTFIEREETIEEQKEREDLEKKIAERIAETKLRMEARKSVLDRLGLTEEEAKLLLG